MLELMLSMILAFSSRSNKDELSEETLKGVSLIVFGSPRERFLQEEVIVGRVSQEELPPVTIETWDAFFFCWCPGESHFELLLLLL